MLKKGSFLLVLGLITAMGSSCGDGGGGGNLGDGGTSDTDSDADTDSDTDTDSDGDADSDGDSDADTDSDAECAEVPWSVTINPINMLILLDRSQSMYTSTIDEVTYADIVADSLSGVVETNTASGLVNFGLAVFPSMACPAGAEGSDYQCTPANSDDVIGGSTDNAPVVAVGADNFAAIDAALGAVGQCGGTPICESLEWALDYLTGSSFPAALAGQQKFVLLATDGAPNCNSSGDIDSCESSDPDESEVNLPEQCLDDICSYNAALQLYAAGIKVFVVGVGEDVATFTGVMQGIAYYGGYGSEATIPTSPEYWYPASDATSLQETLEEITGEAINCTFDLVWEEIPNQTEDGILVTKSCDKVRVFGVDASDNDTELNYDPGCESGGWHWANDNPETTLEDLAAWELDQCTQIELCDDACDNLRDQTWTTVKASFGCEPPIVG